MVFAKYGRFIPIKGGVKIWYGPVAICHGPEVSYADNAGPVKTSVKKRLQRLQNPRCNCPRRDTCVDLQTLFNMQKAAQTSDFRPIAGDQYDWCNG